MQLDIVLVFTVVNSENPVGPKELKSDIRRKYQVRKKTTRGNQKHLPSMTFVATLTNLDQSKAPAGSSTGKAVLSIVDLLLCRALARSFIALGDKRLKL